MTRNDFIPCLLLTWESGSDLGPYFVYFSFAGEYFTHEKTIFRLKQEQKELCKGYYIDIFSQFILIETASGCCAQLTYMMLIEMGECSLDMNQPFFLNQRMLPRNEIMNGHKHSKVTENDVQ